MDTKKELQKAFHFYQQKNFDAASNILLNLIDKYPEHLDALNNLAIIKINQNKPLEAIKLFNQSLKKQLQAPILNNLINVYKQLSMWLDIENLYKENYRKINYDLNIELSYIAALRENRKTEQVLSQIDNLLIQYPNHIDAYISSMFNLNKINEYEKALNVGLRGCDIDPDNFLMLYNMGITYSNLKQPENSIYYLLKAESQKSDGNLFDLWMTLAAQYIKLNAMDKAHGAIDKCKKIGGNSTLIRYQEASIENQSGNLKKAEKLLQSVLKENPNHIEANYMYGLLQLKWGNFDKCLKYFKYRVKRDGLSRVGFFDDFNLPKLDIDTKIIIGWEQGIGDQLLFFRLMEQFSKLVKEIIYVSSEKLLPVLQKNYPNINFITEYQLNSQTIDLYHDYIKLNLGSVLYYLKNIHDITSNSKPLKCEDHKKNFYLKKYKKEKKIIGLSWFSSNDELKDDKSYKLEILEPIFNDSRYSFLCLQYGDVKNDLQKIKNKYQININYEEKLDYYNNICELLALISICDEVITCSNITAHLAGSLGISTKLLVPRIKGRLWYWHEAHIKNDKSLWYPNVRIYAQEKQGTWNQEVIQIKKDLKE